MADAAIFAPQDARMILDTVRQVRASGILHPNHFPTLLNRLPRGGTSDEGSTLKFFTLAEDAGTQTEIETTEIVESEPVIVINWGGIIDTAPEDYEGLFGKVYNETTEADEWVFVQGPCIPPPAECSTTVSSLINSLGN